MDRQKFTVTNLIFSVIDSFAKVPSGLLDGNWLWLGDYDLCTSISVPNPGEEPLTGKYCRTTIQKVSNYYHRHATILHK